MIHTNIYIYITRSIISEFNKLRAYTLTLVLITDSNTDRQIAKIRVRDLHFKQKERKTWRSAAKGSDDEDLGSGEVRRRRRAARTPRVRPVDAVKTAESNIAIRACRGGEREYGGA